MTIMTMKKINKDILEIDNCKFVSISDGIFDVYFNSKNNSKAINGGKDSKTHLRLSINFLYVASPHGSFLIDLGIGSMPVPMFKRHPKTPHLPMAAKLAKYDINIREIDGIIFSHLHLDHIGGYFEYNSGVYNQNFNSIPCYVNEKEWEYQYNKLDRTDSLFKKYFKALEKNVKFTRLNQRITVGIEIIYEGGHTPGHQIILFDTDKHKICYAGDLIATETQLNKNINLPFDRDPERSKQIRDEIYKRAADENWIFVFDHAPHIRFAMLEKIKKNKYIINSIP